MAANTHATGEQCIEAYCRHDSVIIYKGDQLCDRHYEARLKEEGFE